MRKTHDWVASRVFRMMPSGTKIQALDIGTLGQVQPPHPCAVYNFWVMRQTCTSCRSLVIARCSCIEFECQVASTTLAFTRCVARLAALSNELTACSASPTKSKTNTITQHLLQGAHTGTATISSATSCLFDSLAAGEQAQFADGCYCSPHHT